MTVHIVARAIARPDAVEQVLQALQKCLLPTRREPGCQRYQLVRCREAPLEFVMLEEWRSVEDVDAHLQTPHVQQLLAALPALLAAPPDIRSYEVVA